MGVPVSENTEGFSKSPEQTDEWGWSAAGEKLWEVQCDSPTFTVAWHPKRPLLAYACDDKEGKYDNNREAGTVKLFGLPNDS